MKDTNPPPQQWLQIKGDPSIREFVFQQSRTPSLYDLNIDRLMAVAEALVLMHGVFHAKIHFASNQLTCWFYHDPYRYRVFVGEEIFKPDFLEQFPLVVLAERPEIPESAVPEILAHFKRLRLTDQTIYLRNASINTINGTIGMTFSCDGSHYMRWDEFLNKNLGFWFGTAG